MSTKNPETDMRGHAPGGSEPPIVTANGVRENLEPGYDRFTVTDAKRKVCGIEPEMALRWVRDSDTDFWKSATPEDRISEFEDTHDAQLVVQPGKHGRSDRPVKNGDLVLMKYPRAVAERFEAETERERKEVESRRSANMAARKPDGRELSEEERERMRADASEAYRRMGYIGDSSPTHGLSIEEAYNRIPTSQMEADEIRARIGQGRYNGGSRREESVVGDLKHKPSIAVPAVGFDKNPNSSTNRAARIAAKNAG